MKISLISDNDMASIKNVLGLYTEKCSKIEEKLRKIRRVSTLIIEVERELKDIFGDEVDFKKDASGNLYTEIAGEYIPIEEEAIGYEIKINFSTMQVYFDITPQDINPSLSVLDEFNGDMNDEGKISETLDELKQEKEKLSKLEEFLTNHKTRVLNADYSLRKFCKEMEFKYQTNHGFPIPEDKNQIKLEYTNS